MSGDTFSIWHNDNWACHSDVLFDICYQPSWGYSTVGYTFELPLSEGINNNDTMNQEAKPSDFDRFTWMLIRMKVRLSQAFHI